MPNVNPPLLQGYLIGQAARLSGVSAANIRYYEKEKLIERREVGVGRYRFYSPSDVHQLRFIRLLRSMDMSLDEVRTLLALDLRRKSDCAVADAALDQHIGHVRERLRELKSLEKQLVGLRMLCDGRQAQCRLMEALHTHADQSGIAAPKRRQARHV